MSISKYDLPSVISWKRVIYPLTFLCYCSRWWIPVAFGNIHTEHKVSTKVEKNSWFCTNLWVLKRAFQPNLWFINVFKCWGKKTCLVAKYEKYPFFFWFLFKGRYFFTNVSSLFVRIHLGSHQTIIIINTFDIKIFYRRGYVNSEAIWINFLDFFFDRMMVVTIWLLQGPVI